MLMDGLSQYSDNQAVTATAYSTKAIKTGAFPNKVKTKPGPLVQVTADFTGLTSMAVKVYESDTFGGTYTEANTTAAIPLAALKVGYRFPTSFAGVTKAFTKLQYVVVGTGTAGTVTGAYVTGFDDSYESGQYIREGVAE